MFHWQKVKALFSRFFTMFCWQRIKAAFSVILNFLLSFDEKFFDFLYIGKLLFKYLCRFGSKNDFILRVAPLTDKSKDYYRNYFPPPLYGVPPNKKKQEGEDYKKYGLFLWPDYLYVDVRYYLVLLVLTIFPFIYLFKYASESPLLKDACYAIALLLVIVILLRVAFILVALYSPPVLTKIWSLWPETQYQRFLTVPHLTDLHRADKNRNEETQYWQPDKSLSLLHQPMEYRKGKNTLQEVILSLAIFDFLFHSKNDIGEDEAARKSLKMRGWFYLFSPAIISYFLLMLAFFVSAYFYPANLSEFCQDCQTRKIPALLRLPYFYIPLVIIWSGLTFKMIIRQMNFLQNLQKDVREGRYDVHLELIPQQILNVASNIPSDKQISKGIEKMETILRFVQAGALATFFMMLEIFASAFN